MLGADVPGEDDAVRGVHGGDDDVLGGGRALLFFFFFCLRVRFEAGLAGLFLTSVWPYGALEQSMRSSTSTGALPELVVSSGGVSLTSQEHFPSSSTRRQAPITSPLSWLPWGERRISHSLVGDSISGYLSASCPWGVNRGPVMLATVAITSANLLAIPK